MKGEGWELAMKEHYVSFGGKGGHRVDVLGIFDLVFWKDGNWIGIQCCSKSDMATHQVKMEASPWLKRWIECPRHSAMLVGWYPWADEERRDEFVSLQAELRKSRVVWQQVFEFWLPSGSPF